MGKKKISFNHQFYVWKKKWWFRAHIIEFQFLCQLIDRPPLFHITIRHFVDYTFPPFYIRVCVCLYSIMAYRAIRLWKNNKIKRVKITVKGFRRYIPDRGCYTRGVLCKVGSKTDGNRKSTEGGLLWTQGRYSSSRVYSVFTRYIEREIKEGWGEGRAKIL